MKQHVLLLASTNQVKFVMYIYGGGFGLTQLTSFAQFSAASVLSKILIHLLYQLTHLQTSVEKTY